MIAGLLLNSIEKQAELRVAFDPKRCLRARLRGNACERCVAVCGKKALTLNEGSIVFKQDKCTECMACVSVCPNDAFDDGFELSAILHALEGRKGDGPTVLSCGRSFAGGNRVAISCVGLLSEPVLAVLHCLARPEIYLDVHVCAECENGQVLDLLHGRMQGLRVRLGASATPGIRYCLDTTHPGVAAADDRRFFLRKTTSLLANLGRDASAALMPPAAPEVEKGGKNASRTNRLLQEALERLPGQAVREKKLLLSYLNTVTANGNCDLCPACTGMCPTGALQRKKEQDVKRLHFIGARCNGCGLCVEFCKKKALALQPGAGTDPSVAVAIA